MSSFKLRSSISTVIARLPLNYIRPASAPATRRFLSSVPIFFTTSKHSKFIKISPEVENALARKAPIVALESAIITNPRETGGIPYPGNIEYASRAEDEIREMGAIPATIIVVAGFVYVGVPDSDLYTRLMDRDTMKVTQRDLPYVVGMPSRLSGGLTVSATINIAEMVGIKVMATGGIGGVHRSATTLLDISSDVHELGRKNVAVVCSGPKVYLDSMGTIDYLETRGVPVATFGSGSMEVMLPAQYSHSGRVQSPLVVRSEKDAAEIIYASHSLGLKCGQLFCNPIPLKYSLDEETTEKSVRTYFKERKKKNKKNKEIVSDILYTVRKFSRDRAISAEKALLLSNARKAALVAVELSKLERAELGLPLGNNQPDNRDTSKDKQESSVPGVKWRPRFSENSPDRPTGTKAKIRYC